MSFPGSELYWDSALTLMERWYCRLLGVPIVGLRIRLRRIRKVLHANGTMVLDAGCGRSVISRMLAKRYPSATVDAVDADADCQRRNQDLSARMGLANCNYITADLTRYVGEGKYDLVVSVDNLEHVEDDLGVLKNFFASMKDGGTLFVHVPHYYRRWPVWKWRTNFDVPGHVRPGYHLPQLIERVQQAGFTVARSGFSYGFLENLMNNLSYAITGAEERRKIIYAALFPIMNLIAWMGQWSNPKFGAGVWVMATKDVSRKDRSQVVDGDS